MPSGIEVRIEGGEQFARLSAVLKANGNTQLRLKMLRGIRAAAAPAVEAIKHEAEETLPKTGGLNTWVGGSKIAARTRSAGANPWVRVKSASKGPGRDARAINAGTARHPVWGNRKVWADTSVTGGFWDKGSEVAGPLATAEMVKVLDETAVAIAAEMR